MIPNEIGLTPNLYDCGLQITMRVELDDVEYVTETTLTIRGTRRRTTVPKVIVEKLGLQSGDKIRWILFKDGNILVTRVRRD